MYFEPWRPIFSCIPIPSLPTRPIALLTALCEMQTPVADLLQIIVMIFFKLLKIPEALQFGASIYVYNMYLHLFAFIHKFIFSTWEMSTEERSHKIVTFSQNFEIQISLQIFNSACFLMSTNEPRFGCVVLEIAIYAFGKKSSNFCTLKFWPALGSIMMMHEDVYHSRP